MRTRKSRSTDTFHEVINFSIAKSLRVKEVLVMKLFYWLSVSGISLLTWSKIWHVAFQSLKTSHKNMFKICSKACILPQSSEWCSRSIDRRYPVTKKLNFQRNTCARVSFLINLQIEASCFIKKGTLTQMFSCEFCEIFKDSFLIEQLWWLLLVLFRKFHRLHRKALAKKLNFQ